MFERRGIRSQLQAELVRLRSALPSGESAEWVELAGSCQDLLNVVGALQTVALAHVAATEDVVREDGTLEEEFRGLGHQRLDAPALVQDLLGLTSSGATDRMATAVDLVTRHLLSSTPWLRARSTPTAPGSWRRSSPRPRPRCVARWSPGSVHGWALKPAGH